MAESYGAVRSVSLSTKVSHSHVPKMRFGFRPVLCLVDVAVQRTHAVTMHPSWMVFWRAQ